MLERCSLAGVESRVGSRLVSGQVADRMPKVEVLDLLLLGSVDVPIFCFPLISFLLVLGLRSTTTSAWTPA